jgi:hypothetical protein
MADTPKHTGFTPPPLGVVAPCLDDAAIAGMSTVELKKICKDMKLHQGGAKDVLRARVENFIDHNQCLCAIQEDPVDDDDDDAPEVEPGFITKEFVDRVFNTIVLETEINLPSPLVPLDYHSDEVSERDLFFRDACELFEEGEPEDEADVGRIYVHMSKLKRRLKRKYGLKRPTMAAAAAASAALDALARSNPPHGDDGFDENLKARLIMVLTDQDLAGDLDRINQGDTTRAEIEATDPWDAGVAVAFNDNDFAPANDSPDNLDVAHLDPSRAPTTPRSGAFLKSKLSSLKSEYNRVRSLDRPSTEPLWPYRVFYATTFEAGLEAAPSHGRPF